MYIRISFLVWVFFCTVFSSLCSDEFAFDPPRGFTLSPQYIAVHHPVKTNNISAQLYFDQGLTFLYAFNHEAAYWSFLKASQIDPQMPMAYWGMALVLGTNINMGITSERAKIANSLAQKALQLAADGPEVEKAYAQAITKRYSNDPKSDLQQLAIDYSRAMKGLTDKYPDDPDAAVLYAESLLNVSPWNQWSNDGKPQEGTLEAVGALEKVLVNHPEHIGANHYYIHAIEASPYPERALLSADRLRRLLPSSGHILHMPSHIYILVGDYEQAVLSNENAVAADREYIRRYGVKGIYPIHYLSHNYHFLSQAYSMQGNYVGAKLAAEDLSALYLPHVQRMPELEQYASTLMFVNLRFQKWKQLLNMPEPPASMHITRALRHFGRSVALANLGYFEAALDERENFLKEKSQLSKDTKYGFNKASLIFSLAQYYLEAKLYQAQGNNQKAIEYFRKAVEEQDKLSYDEPPNWLFSVRESLGATLIKEGKFQEAEKVFREDLKQHPRSGRSLFGLRESLAAQSKWSDYYWVDQAYQEAWKFSDINLNLDKL